MGCPQGLLLQNDLIGFNYALIMVNSQMRDRLSMFLNQHYNIIISAASCYPKYKFTPAIMTAHTVINPLPSKNQYSASKSQYSAFKSASILHKLSTVACHSHLLSKPPRGENNGGKYEEGINHRHYRTGWFLPG